MPKYPLFFLLLFVGRQAFAQHMPSTVAVISPNKAVKATVELDARGHLHYNVTCTKNGTPITVVPQSALGISTNDADFSHDLAYTGLISDRKIVDHYHLIHGKRSECHNEAMEKTFRFSTKNGRLLDLTFRAYDNGVAFRYTLPQTSGEHRGVTPEDRRITGERTSFVIPDGTQRWMQQYTPTYEALYPSATTGKADAPDHQQWGFPALYELQNTPLWVLITEADVSRDNCASHLSNKDDSTIYRVTMPEDAIPAGPGWKSAWRVLMIGSLADIVGSTLVTDLSDPSKLDTTSWIKPGPVAWVYWAYNHGSKDYEKVVEYVNLAKAMHWPYVLIDWEWDRMGNGGNIEDAVAYARSQGIKPLMWYNSRDSLSSSAGLDPYGRLTTHEARCKEFAWLNKIGVFGVKVDFFEDDRQKEMAYYLDLLQDAANYHLMVDFHGATIPKGWDRTYPNLMTMEAVYGAEWYAYAPVLTRQGAKHNATLPFTRNVVGPMDYTPVTFTDALFPHTTTFAHELALSVVFESGLQHFADRPAGFDSLPAPERQFLMTVPVAWDDTRLIDGFPGERVVIARRKDHTWYIGGLNGQDQPQTLQLHFDFLPAGAYDLKLIRDGATGKEFNTQTIPITKDSKIEVNCLPRGGFAATLVPAKPGSQTSDSLSLNAIPQKLFWEKHPLKFSNFGDSLIIEAPGGTDIYRDSYGYYSPNKAPRLLFQADSNFILTVDVRHAFSDEWNAGGILLEADSTHWIKFCFEKDYKGAHRIVSVVTDDYSDDCNAVALPTNGAFLKLAKAGDVIILYYSQDGSTWYMARRLRYVFTSPLLVGFLAQAPGARSNAVHFSQIRYQLKKVTNPFGID